MHTPTHAYKYGTCTCTYVRSGFTLILAHLQQKQVYDRRTSGERLQAAVDLMGQTTRKRLGEESPTLSPQSSLDEEEEEEQEEEMTEEEEEEEEEDEEEEEEEEEDEEEEVDLRGDRPPRSSTSYSVLISNLTRSFLIS